MLRRVLIVVAVLYLVWRIAAAWGKRLRRDEPGADHFSRFSGRGRGPRRQSDGGAPEELVPCAHCGTYVPVARVLASGDGELFCSRECRAAEEPPTEQGGVGG